MILINRIMHRRGTAVLIEALGRRPRGGRALGIFRHRVWRRTTVFRDCGARLRRGGPLFDRALGQRRAGRSDSRRGWRRLLYLVFLASTEPDRCQPLE